MYIDKYLHQNFRQCKRNFMDIYYLMEYHPYWIHIDDNKVKNPNFDKLSSDMLAFKKGNHIEIVGNILYKRLKNLLKVTSDICLITVPSHDGKISSMQKTLIYLLNQYNMNTYPTVLKRKYAIPKLSNGGERDYWLLYNSLGLETNVDLEESNIILLDDITTTGTTFCSARNFLFDNINKEKKIFCISLAKTVRENNE